MYLSNSKVVTFDIKIKSSWADADERHFTQKVWLLNLFQENLDCAGHKVFVKTNREKAKLRPGYKEKETFNKTETLENKTETTENKTETMDTSNDTGIKPEAAAISTMTTAAGFLEIITDSAQSSIVEPKLTSGSICLDSDKNTLNNNEENSWF